MPHRATAPAFYSFDDINKPRLNVSEKRSSVRVSVPACLHQFPTLVFKIRQPLRSNATPNGRPQVIFASALLKCQGKADCACADIPEKDTKGVHVYAVVIATRKQFWRHVNGCPYDGSRHHCLWFTKPKVCYFATVLRVQLQARIGQISCVKVGKFDRKISIGKFRSENCSLVFLMREITGQEKTIRKCIIGT